MIDWNYLTGNHASRDGRETAVSMSAFPVDSRSRKLKPSGLWLRRPQRGF